MKKRIFVSFVCVFFVCGMMGCAAKQGEMAGSARPTESEENNQVVESEVTSEAEKDGITNGSVRVMWAEGVDTAGMQEYIVDSSGAQSKIMILAEEDVTSFQFLSLEVNGADQDGKISYEANPLYGCGMLTKDHPLIVGLTFVGDIPAYGISYEDANGETKRFSINISGENGELLLEEF